MREDYEWEAIERSPAISFGLAFLLGTAGLLHILVRSSRSPTRARRAARSAGPSC
jgi:Na+(H+)/acetate symporter ActP